MTAQLKFSTLRFSTRDASADSGAPNGAEAMLAWVAERLTVLGLVRDVRVVSLEGRGRVDIEVLGEPYRLESVQRGDQSFVLTVSARRSLVDWLLGRGEVTENDALLRIVLEILERQPDFLSIEQVLSRYS